MKPMSPDLDATDASILTLIAQTPDLAGARLERLLQLIKNPDVRLVGNVLARRDWAYPSADVVDLARALYESAERQRQQHAEPVTA
jgi:hypothetical protein